ncbi:transposase [Gimesia algae]|uniref:Transposase n=1 Tax=Gimesia algae TaxID=2527971 RepID=A0A517VIK4_9PLAN|nr:transposase [Gimesia algae]QDT92822.1 Transposase [Gimesia algae]
MPTKRHSSEQIISKLREAKVHLAQGMTIPQMCKKLAIHQQTYYKWRREYGGLRMDQAKRLKELEKENARLNKLLAESELDKAILREAASGNY